MTVYDQLALPFQPLARRHDAQTSHDAAHKAESFKARMEATAVGRRLAEMERAAGLL